MRQEGVIGLRRLARRVRACALLSNERRVPGRSHGRHSALSTRPTLSACSPFLSATHALGLPWYNRYQLGEEGQSRQVNTGVVVIFTQQKSCHMFARCKNIISACPVFLQHCACHEFVKVYYRTYSQSYLAAIRGVRGHKTRRRCLVGLSLPPNGP